MSFDNFKSNVSHFLKSVGDFQFIRIMLKNNKIQDYFDKGCYKEAFYLLAALDYISRVNNIPVCDKFDHIRKYKLKALLYPSNLLLLDSLTKEDLKKKAINEAIPEFLHFNIVEKDMRNSV